MDQQIGEMTLNGVTYVPKGSVVAPATKVDGMEFVIIRTFSAGVHVGYLESREGKEVVLRNSRRIWKWAGANELCQVALIGVDKVNSKISATVDRIVLTEAIEIINCTGAARDNICEVPEWVK